MPLSNIAINSLQLASVKEGGFTNNNESEMYDVQDTSTTSTTKTTNKIDEESMFKMITNGIDTVRGLPASAQNSMKDLINNSISNDLSVAGLGVSKRIHLSKSVSTICGDFNFDFYLKYSDLSDLLKGYSLMALLVALLCMGVSTAMNALMAVASTMTNGNMFLREGLSRSLSHFGISPYMTALGVSTVLTYLLTKDSRKNGTLIEHRKSTPKDRTRVRSKSKISVLSMLLDMSVDRGGIEGSDNTIDMISEISNTSAADNIIYGLSTATVTVSYDKFNNLGITVTINNVDTMITSNIEVMNYILALIMELNPSFVFDGILLDSVNIPTANTAVPDDTNITALVDNNYLYDLAVSCNETSTIDDSLVVVNETTVDLETYPSGYVEGVYLDSTAIQDFTVREVAILTE